MPLASDPGGGGTCADGSRSVTYCSYCYRAGKFVGPATTIDQMRALIIDKLAEKGYPRFIARFFTIGLERLERWRR